MTGRPTVMTPEVVQKLEEALRSGFSVEMACYVSGIARSTYYAHIGLDGEFSDKMTLAQAWVTERAKQVVAQAVESGDLKASMWWLERRARYEFASNPPEKPQPYQDPFQVIEPEELSHLERAIAALKPS